MQEHDETDNGTGTEALLTGPPPDDDVLDPIFDDEDALDDVLDEHAGPADLGLLDEDEEDDDEPPFAEDVYDFPAGPYAQVGMHDATSTGSVEERLARLERDSARAR